MHKLSQMKRERTNCKELVIIIFNKQYFSLLNYDMYYTCLSITEYVGYLDFMNKDRCKSLWLNTRK